jgi:hypothetical protein
MLAIAAVSRFRGNDSSPGKDAAVYEVTYKVTDFFLDRAEVLRKIGIARAKALSRQGAFIRKRARTDVLRRRKGVSSPGSAPSVHSKDPIQSLKNILFFYDARTRSVVVGPVRLNQRNMTGNGSISIPQLMEFGGTVNIREERFRGGTMWFRRDNRRTQDNRRKEYRERSATYRPRPFMAVALQREVQAGTVAAAWANVMRAA